MKTVFENQKNGISAHFDEESGKFKIISAEYDDPSTAVIFDLDDLCRIADQMALAAMKIVAKRNKK